MTDGFQTTDMLLMVEPAAFFSNPATAIDNHFQREIHIFSRDEVQAEALREFKEFSASLQQQNVEIIVFKDAPENRTPDSIFPNNWFTTHADSTFVLYPMKEESRRHERRPDIIGYLKARYQREVDFRSHEDQGRFLEGTGSLVLDRVNRIAYACRSQRTHEALLAEWGKVLNYRIIDFAAFDHTGDYIYHTNVMMNMGTKFVVLCLESITDAKERGRLIKSFSETKHEIIDISLAQMRAYCGNILEVKSKQGISIIAMSQRAFNHFSDEQLRTLRHHGEIVHSDLSTIETYGGGGARCMLAELF